MTMAPSPIRRSAGWRGCWLAGVAACAAAVGAHAQDGAGAPISAAAEPAFQRGLADAQAGQYELAAEDFATAYRLDQNAPAIWFNYGLSLSRLSNHEIPAKDVLDAYLAAEPDDPRAAQIQQLIEAQKASFRAKLLKIDDELRDLLPRLPGRQDCIQLAGDLAQQEAESGFLARATAYLHEWEKGGVCAPPAPDFHDTESTETALLGGQFGPRRSKPVPIRSVMDKLTQNSDPYDQNEDFLGIAAAGQPRLDCSLFLLENCQTMIRNRMHDQTDQDGLTSATVALSRFYQSLIDRLVGTYQSLYWTG